MPPFEYLASVTLSRPEQVRQYFLLVECNNQDEKPMPFEDKKHTQSVLDDLNINAAAIGFLIKSWHK
jgi:hypothetical protein